VNQIGGNFSRTSSEPGIVRVVNNRCPCALERSFLFSNGPIIESLRLKREEANDAGAYRSR
jgi:hypothetical protein